MSNKEIFERLNKLFDKDMNSLQDLMHGAIIANAHKGFWDSVEPERLFLFLQENEEKLRKAFIKNDVNGVIFNTVHIANYCMMILGNFKRYHGKA